MQDRRLLEVKLVCWLLHLPADYSDEKCIDTLIWRFVPFLEGGCAERRIRRLPLTGLTLSGLSPRGCLWAQPCDRGNGRIRIFSRLTTLNRPAQEV